MSRNIWELASSSTYQATLGMGRHIEFDSSSNTDFAERQTHTRVTPKKVQMKTLSRNGDAKVFVRMWEMQRTMNGQLRKEVVENIAEGKLYMTEALKNSQHCETDMQQHQ